MCEYCTTRASNKIIKDIDNDNEDRLEVVRLAAGTCNFLKVELDATDEDGYKAVDYFPILYCPMCGRKINRQIKFRGKVVD